MIVRCLLLTMAMMFSGLDARAEDKPLPRVVGHRGMLQTHPENTLAGFETCWKLGICAELDIRRTKDGHLVIMHDDTVDRTTTGTGKVNDLTLAEVKKLDAGKKFKDSFAGTGVPELREVLALLKKHPFPGIAIAVDLKIDDGKVEADVVKQAKEAGVLDRLLFIGNSITDASVRERLRTADPGAHICCLALSSDKLAAAIEDKHSDWVYLRFVPSAEQMKSIRQAKKKVFLSGPLFQKKEHDNWKKAHEAGADAILTDYPVELKEMQRSLGK